MGQSSLEDGEASVEGWEEIVECMNASKERAEARQALGSHACGLPLTLSTTHSVSFHSEEEKEAADEQARNVERVEALQAGKEAGAGAEAYCDGWDAEEDCVHEMLSERGG